MVTLAKANKSEIRKQKQTKERKLSFTKASAKRSVAKNLKLVDYLTNDWQYFMQEKTKAENILKRYRSALAASPQVTGLEVGLRQKGKSVVLPPEYVIVIYVEKRLPKEAISKDFLFPEFIEGVRVNVIERNFQKAVGFASKHHEFRQNPVGGISIACNIGQGQIWGTLGLQCYLPNNDKVYLTNAHVVQHKPFCSIIQPEHNDVPPGSRKAIGKVSYISDVDDAEVDCALISTNSLRAPGKQSLLNVGSFNVPTVFDSRDLTSLDENQTKVFKIGASTGSDPVLFGIVEKVDSGDVVVYDKILEKNRTYNSQIIVRPELEGQKTIDNGDSGSIMVTIEKIGDMDVCKVVGLVHGMSLETTGDKPQDRKIIACPIRAVIRECHISVKRRS